MRTDNYHRAGDGILAFLWLPPSIGLDAQSSSAGRRCMVMAVKLATTCIRCPRTWLRLGVLHDRPLHLSHRFLFDRVHKAPPLAAYCRDNGVSTLMVDVASLSTYSLAGIAGGRDGQEESSHNRGHHECN